MGWRQNSVGKIIDTLFRNDLVILDEVGFAPLDDHPSVIRKSEMGAENRSECGKRPLLECTGRSIPYLYEDRNPDQLTLRR